MKKPKTLFYRVLPDQPIQKEEIWENSLGELHREDGPAVISYREDGSLHTETWFINDKMHRLDGPAMIKYYPDGRVKSYSWYINGRSVTKIELDAHNPSTDEERLIEIYFGNDDELREIAFAHPNFPKWAKDWIDPS